MERKERLSWKVREVLRMAVRHIATSAPRPGTPPAPPMWPLPVLLINRLHTMFFVQEIHSVLERLWDKGPEKLGKLLWGPSAIAHWSYFAQLTPFIDMGREQLIEFFERTADLLLALRREDPFCKEERNVIWDESKLEEVKGLEFVKPSPEEKRLLSTINVSLWQYARILQCNHHVYSHEFHGPYDLGDSILLVREYFDLKPVQVWEEVKGFPYEKLLILETYRKGFDLRIDTFNHLYSDEPLPNNLTSFLILVDGKEFAGRDKDDFLTELNQALNNSFSELSSHISSFSPRDWFEKIIWMRHYYLRKAKELLSEDWKPTSEELKLAEQDPEEMRREVMPFVGRQFKIAMENPPEVAEKLLLELWEKFILEKQ